MLQIEIAIARAAKYAAGESGDVAEVMERPSGGASVVLVDGQGSGAAARAIAMLVSGRALALLRDGVRDEYVVAAAADFLHVHRRGQVSATLDLVTVDAQAGVVRLVRNNPAPAYVRSGCVVNAIGCGSSAIGPIRDASAVTVEIPLTAPMQCMVFTDGLLNSGGVAAPRPVIGDWIEELDMRLSARESADALLARALRADSFRPRDDMTVVAISIAETGDDSNVRSTTLTFPATRHP